MEPAEPTSRRVALSQLFRRDAVWALVLALLVLALYSPTLWHGFALLDDHLYVVRNYSMHAGPTVGFMREAITSFSPSNWHPLTLLSHALDCSLYGLSPAGHHATNLLLHSLATVVLFLFFCRVQSNRARAFLVACLFAFHPIQVETVAWISSRKGLLSTLFAFLALSAHAEYASSRRRLFYLLGLVTAGLALASKSMVVTLPLLLLIVDYWPLNRWPGEPQPGPVNRAAQARRLGALLYEKIPYALLSAGCVWLTLQAHGQQRVFHEFSWPARFANSFQSYVVYLQKALWPSGLSIYYPHSGEEFSGWLFALNVLVVSGLFYLAWRNRNSRPALTSGWLWYFVSLLPVIGLIPINGNGWADRYAYLPLVGFFWAITSLVPDRWFEGRVAGRATAVTAFLLMLALGTATVIQVRLWRSNEALFEHALTVNDKNAVAHVGYATGRAERGDLAAAERHARIALEIDPDLSWARNVLGGLLLRQGRDEEALVEFQRSVNVAPSMLEWRSNAAQAAANLGRTQQARTIWNEILSENPGEPAAHNGLGQLALNAGDLDEAKRKFEVALQLSPYYVDAWKGLGYVAIESRRYDEAAQLLGKAIELSPGTADDARLQLAKVFNSTGRYSAAEHLLRDLMTRTPNLPNALGPLAWSLVKQERIDEAVVPLEHLVRERPKDPAALHSLGRVLAALNRPAEALRYLERVEQLEPGRAGLQPDLTRVRIAIQAKPTSTPVSSPEAIKSSR